MTSVQSTAPLIIFLYWIFTMSFAECFQTTLRTTIRRCPSSTAKMASTPSSQSHPSIESEYNIILQLIQQKQNEMQALQEMKQQLYLEAEQRLHSTHESPTSAGTNLSS